MTPKLYAFVEGKTDNDRSKAIQELRLAIRSEDPQIKAEHELDDEEAQDLGAILGIVLSSGAVIAVAHGVQKWLENRKQAKVTLKIGDDQLVVENVPGRDATVLARDITRLVGKRMGQGDPESN